MINQGIAEAKAAVNEHVSNPAVLTGDPEIDNFSISAKRAFVEAYEHLFEQVGADLTEKAESI